MLRPLAAIQLLGKTRLLIWGPEVAAEGKKGQRLRTCSALAIPKHAALRLIKGGVRLPRAPSSTVEPRLRALLKGGLETEQGEGKLSRW